MADVGSGCALGPLDDFTSAADVELKLLAASCRSGKRSLDEYARIICHADEFYWCVIDMESVDGGLKAMSGGAGTLDPTTGASPRGGVRRKVRYKQATLGELRVGLSMVTRLRPEIRTRITRISQVLGPILHALAMQETLQAQFEALEAVADELGETRLEAIAAQDDQRRALERNLHDGAQHHLVALRAAVGLLEYELTEDSVSGVASRLTYLRSTLDLTERGLVETAAGTLPPLLVERGLLDAFDAELPNEPAVLVTADDEVRRRRYPLQVEVGVYYACLEAVNNAAKHAPHARVQIELNHTYRGLRFAVVDNGPGFDAPSMPSDSSLGLLGDRVAAIGGELTLRSAPGVGTIISGFIPI